MRTRNSGKSSFQILFSLLDSPTILLSTSSNHAFQPRLRRAIRIAESLSWACSVLGSAPNDPAHAESRFLESVQMIVRLSPRPSFGTAVSICVVISWTFCDFISTQNTSVFSLTEHVDCQLETPWRFCVGNFREKGWHRCVVPTTANNRCANVLHCFQFLHKTLVTRRASTAMCDAHEVDAELVSNSKASANACRVLLWVAGARVLKARRPELNECSIDKDSNLLNALENVTPPSPRNGTCNGSCAQTRHHTDRIRQADDALTNRYQSDIANDL